MKAEIIYMLGQKSDPLAVEFVKDNLDAPDQNIREESVTALLKLQGREATPDLIAHLSEGKDIETTKRALQQLLDEKHLRHSAILRQPERVDCGREMVHSILLLDNPLMPKNYAFVKFANG